MVDAWASTRRFLRDMVKEGVLGPVMARRLPTMLCNALKKGRRHRQSKFIDILNGFRHLCMPRLVINLFLFSPAAVSEDPRTWIIFVSALHSTRIADTRFKPSNAALSHWVVRQTHTTVARQFPVIYSMCLRVCMREGCPRRMIAILRCMQRDGAANGHILHDALVWCLSIEHFECSLKVVSLMKQEDGTIPRLTGPSVIWSQPLRDAPRIVRRLLASARRLGLIERRF